MVRVPPLATRRTSPGLASTLVALLIACASDPAPPPVAPPPPPPPPADGGLPAPDAAPFDSGGPRVDSGLAADAEVDAGRPYDVSEESDDFSGAALDPRWSVFQPDAVQVEQSGGELVLRLSRAALWFNAQQGVLIHRPIRGDFKLTARVHARKASAPAEPPDRTVHLGGLMARDPSSALENYVFIVAGRDENDVSVETKSTRDSMSSYVGPSWPGGDAELRLCRVGSLFRLLKRAIGAPDWTIAQDYVRPDLPATLQVGPNIYSYGAPDLLVRFEEARFAAVAREEDCALD